MAIVPIALGKGLDLKTDPKQVVQGKLLALNNATLQAPNSIIKRNGYNQIGPSLSAGVTLDGFNDQLIETDGTYVNAFINASDTWRGSGSSASDEGLYIPLDVNMSNIATTYAPSVAPDSAYLSGYQCFVWSITTGGPLGGAAITASYYSVIDRASGSFVVDGALIPSSSTALRVVAFPAASSFVIFCMDGAGSEILYYTINISSPTTISTQTTVVGTAIFCLDTVVIGSSLYVGIPTGGSSIKLIEYNSSMTPTTVASISDTGSIVSLCSDPSNNVWVFHYSSPSLEFSVYNSSGGLVTSGSVSWGTTAPLNLSSVFIGTTAYLFISASVISTTISTSGLCVITVTLSGFGALTQLCYAGLMISRAFSYNGIPYVIQSVQGDSSYLFAGTLINAYGSAQPLARLAFELTGFFTYANNAVPTNVNFISGGIFQYAFINNTGQINVASYAAGVSTEEINLAPPSPQRAVASNGLYLSGGMLSVYDGNASTEYGFLQIPVVSATSLPSGGSLPAGTYSVTAIYEWFDAKGNHWRSAPGIAQEITTSGSSSQIFVTVTTLQLTAKQSEIFAGVGNNPVQITLWLTEANGTNHFGPVDQFVNNPTLATVSANFKSPPNGTGLILYTDSGEVENIAPPAAALLWTYRDRLMLVPSENRTAFWYSKEAANGFPAEFSDLFQQQITPDGGGITAGIQMDDKNILFKSATPYYITGIGPAPNGTANDFTPEQIITSPVGTQNPQSVVLTPDGVMFQASYGAGIWLLDRSLGVSYIGADVEGFNSYTVTSAVMIPNTTQVRFTLSSGVALVWDYREKQWSVFQNISAVAATIYQGVYTYLTAAGVVNQEALGSYTDNGSSISISLTTGWLPVSGIQNFFRVHELLLLGSYFSPHTLTVQLAFDFAPTFYQSTPITPSSNVPYNYRVFFKQQKCTAFQIQITETPVASFGQGFSLSNIALDVDQKTGMQKIAAAQSYG